MPALHDHDSSRVTQVKQEQLKTEIKSKQEKKQRESRDRKREIVLSMTCIGGDHEEVKQQKVAAPSNNAGLIQLKKKKIEDPLLVHQFPFHALSLNKVKNIEVDRLRLSLVAPKRHTSATVDSAEEICEDQDTERLKTIPGQVTDEVMDERLDHMCSCLHAIPRKNRSKLGKRRTHKASSRKHRRF